MDQLAPAELPKADVSEFKAMLQQLEEDSEFQNAPDPNKAQAIAALRDKYKSTRQADDLDLKAIDGFSKAASDYNKTKRYSVDPETFVKNNIEYPELDALPKESALEKINKFRTQSEEASVNFDPILRDDYLFDLQREANELERRVRGKETGVAKDKGYRVAQGMVGGLLRSTGFTEEADEFETKFFPENPEFDEDYISKLATAGGDFVTTIGMIGAATMVGGPYAGAAVGLTTNSIRKYEEGYAREFGRTGDQLAAHDAGTASIPGAFFENAGDLIVGGRALKGVMSSQLRKAYMEAPTGAARAEIIKQAIKDSTFRSKVIRAGAVGFMAEGSAEVIGDTVAGVGAYSVTGDKGAIPTGKQMWESFSIGGILGGTVSAAGAAVTRTDPIVSNKDHVAKLQEFIANNDEVGLTDYFQSQMVTKLNVTTAPILPPIADKTEVVNKPDGSIDRILKNKKTGESISFDESTAKLHDDLIDYLSAYNEIDTFDNLESGNKKGQASSPPINNKRAAQKNLALTIEDSINAAIPRRAEQFAEIDATAAATNIDPKQVALFKRTVDAAAVTAIQNGIDPAVIYKPTFQVGKIAEPVSQPNIKLDEKTTLDRQEEVNNLILSQAPEKIEAAKKANPIEYFAPEAIKAAQGGGKARYTLVDMPIDDYLSLAEPINPTDSKISEVRKDEDKERLAVFEDDFTTSEQNVEALKQLAEEGTLFDSVPSLSLDDIRTTGTSKVVGHEGRHRAMALKALGHTTMPVQINSNRIRWGMQSVPNNFDFIAENEWPTQLESENGSVSIPYPIGRDGKYKTGNSTLSQVKDIQRLAEETGRNDIAMFANSFQQFIKGPDKTEEDVNRISKDFLNDMSLNISKYVPRSETLVITADSYLMMEDGTQFDPSNPIHANTATPAQWQIYDAQKTGRLNEVLMREQEAVYDERVSDLQASLLPYLYDNINLNDNGPSYTAPEAALIALAASKFGYTIRKSNNADGFEVNVVSISANNRVSIPIVDGMMASELGDIIQSQPNIKLKDAFKIAVTNATRKSQEENVSAGNSGWVTFEKSNSQEDAIKLNKACAGTSWCTGGAVSTAQSHLSGGNFYVYFKDGQAEIAIRTNDGRIAEVAGNTPRQDPMPWMNEEAENFITEDSSRFTGAEGFIEDRNMDRLIDKILKDEPYDKRELARLYKADIDRFIIELPKRNFNGHGDRVRPQVVSDAVAEKTSKYSIEEIVGEKIAPPGIYDISDKNMFKILSNAETLLGEVSIQSSELLEFNEYSNTYTRVDLPDSFSLNAKRASKISIGSYEETNSLGFNFRPFNVFFPNLDFAEEIKTIGATNLSLPVLTKATNIDLEPETTIDAPNLIGVVRARFRANTNTTLPSLKTLSYIELGFNSTLNAPKLKSSIGEIVMNDSSTLNAPELDSIGVLDISVNSNVNTPKLRRATSLKVDRSSEYDNVNFQLPSIQKLGRIQIDNVSVKNILPNLQEVGEIKSHNSEFSLPNLTSIRTGYSSIFSLRNSTLTTPLLVDAPELRIDLYNSNFVADNLKSARSISSSGSRFINFPSLESLSSGIDIINNSGNIGIVSMPKLKEVFTDSSKMDLIADGSIYIKAEKIDLRSYEKGGKRLSLQGEVDLNSLEYISDMYVMEGSIVFAPKLKDQNNKSWIAGTLTAPLIENPRLWDIKSEGKIIGKGATVFENQHGKYPDLAMTTNDPRRLNDPIPGNELFQKVDDESPSILNQTQENQGSIQFQNEDGSLAPLEVPIDQLNNKLSAVINIMENGGNISTFHHEMMHWYHRSGLMASLLNSDQLSAFQVAANVENNIWKEENYETVARAYEAWLRNPTKRFDKHINVPRVLDLAFKKISSAFQNVYRSLKNSPLPSSLSARGIAQPSIHPDFRIAFESLYNFDQSIQLNVESNTATPQNASQLPPVNSQLTQDPNQVSSPQTSGQTTEPQLTKEEELQKEEERKANELNIKLVTGFKPEATLDSAAVGHFKDILQFKSILDPDSELGGLFYSILDNYARSRRLSKRQGTPPEIRRPIGTEAFNRGDFNIVKDPNDPRYTESVNNVLKTIEKEAFKMWYEDYASRHPELEDSSFEDFGSKKDVQNFVQDSKEKKIAESDEVDQTRQSIDDNIAELQTVLKSRNMSDLPMPTAGPLRDATEKFVIFLRDYDVTNKELDNKDAFRIQFMLDSMLNDDTVLGIGDFSKHVQNAYSAKLNGTQKFRAPYSKHGLVGVLNEWFGIDISTQFTNLALVSANLEKVAGNFEALKWLQDFVAPYYDSSAKAKEKKREFRKFLDTTRKKWTDKKTNLVEFHNTSGIISKLIQVPEDFNSDQRNEGLLTNIEQFKIGVENMIKQGGNTGKAGLNTQRVLNEILDGAPLEHEQFINHVANKFPKNFGWIEDAVSWVNTNITDDAKFVSEGLYGSPFSRYAYYLPTQMINLVNPELDVHVFDESHAEGDGENDFVHRSPIHVSRSGNLKSRVGYIPDSKETRGKYAYATNLENTMIKGVDAVINDIYTGFARKVLAAVNPSAGGIYQMMADKMGGTKETENHVRKVLSDMVNTDLDRHKYVSALEAMTSSFRRNIAPAMLSSVHQAITQPVSQMVAHGVRRPELLRFYPKALKMLLHTKMEGDVNGFREVLNRVLAERALPYDPLLTKGQTSEVNNRLNDLILSHVVKDGSKWNELKNKTHLLHEGAKDFLLLGLKLGDTLSADAIFASELIAAGQAEQRISDPMAIDYNAISPEAIHRAVIVMDEAINASFNSRRGNYLAHPSVVMSLLTIFAGHRISVATTFGVKLRNGIDAIATGQYDDPMVKDSVKYMAATVLQSVAFTSVKFMLMAPIVKGLYQALTPDEDDERHWLYGELEKKQVENIRKLSDEAIQRGFGEGVLSASIIRDLFGNIVSVTAFGGLDNVIFTHMDTFRKPEFEIAKQEAIDQINKQVKDRMDILTPAQLQDFKNQIEAIEKTKFASMGFKSFDTADVGGGLGAAIGPVNDFVGALTDIPNETRRFTFEEFALFMRTVGVGQPEITRALKFSAKVKDEIEKEEAEAEANVPTFDF